MPDSHSGEATLACCLPREGFRVCRFLPSLAVSASCPAAGVSDGRSRLLAGSATGSCGIPSLIPPSGACQTSFRVKDRSSGIPRSGCMGSCRMNEEFTVCLPLSCAARKYRGTLHRPAPPFSAGVHRRWRRFISSAVRADLPQFGRRLVRRARFPVGSGIESTVEPSRCCAFASAGDAEHTRPTGGGLGGFHRPLGAPSWRET